MRVVADEPEHDEVSIQPIEAMSDVGIVARLRLCKPDVLHDLVLSFSGHFMPAENDLDASPGCVFSNLLCDKIFELHAEPRHEWRSGRDGIAIERVVFRQDLSLAQRLVADLLCLLGRSETPAALLVHLGARCDAIDGHEEELVGLDDGEEMLYIREDC